MAPKGHDTKSRTPLVDVALSEREYFRCTDEEVEAIETLKLELRRDCGIKTSKQDIERFALKAIIEDYKQNTEESIICNALNRKR